VRRPNLAWTVALWLLAAGSCDQVPAPAPLEPLSAKGEPILSAADSPQVILEKAIQAHGGPACLARWKCGRVKYRTRSDTIPLLNDKPSTVEEFFELPGHFKRVTVIGQGDRQRAITWIVSGDQGWEYQPDGTTRLLPAVTINAAIRTEHAFSDFCNLVRLRNPGFRLEVRGTQTVHGRPAVVLHAEADGANPMDYCFDTVTALLVRSVRHLPQPKGDERLVEIELGDYREIAGAPVAMRVVGRSEGQVLLDFALLEVEFVDHFDEGTFVPPDTP
jgi:hypothetical protein